MEFKRIWDRGKDDEIFAELVFCILTPQSKAKVCWRVVKTLKENGLLLKGNERKLVKELRKVRFGKKKASFIIKARALFMKNGKLGIKKKTKDFKSSNEAREWLVKNVKGLGYKEASHFLRNIGRARDLAILDRHILKNLKLFGISDEAPKYLSKKKYFEIERKMKEFSKKIGIPLSHLDFVLWYKETGEVFK